MGANKHSGVMFYFHPRMQLGYLVRIIKGICISNMVRKRLPCVMACLNHLIHALQQTDTVVIISWLEGNDPFFIDFSKTQSILVI